MEFLPLPPPAHTPVRVLTIAGSDSGGGAGMQADMRTLTLLGVHALAAVTAVTVQNSLGVTGFHEIPADVVAGQIESVATDIGVQAAKTGFLASGTIIETVAGMWRDLGLAGAVPLVVDPVSASMRGDPLLHPPALDAMRTGCSPGRPGHPEPRRGAPARRCRGGRLRHPARGRPCCMTSGPAGLWSRVDISASHRPAPTLLFDDTEFHEFDARRIATPHDHGAGDTLSAAIACALAQGYPMPEAVAFGKAWVTECLRAAYPLGSGHGPVSALFRLGS